MTDTELKELPVFIAERVMGWKLVKSLAYYGQGSFMVSHETGDIMAFDRKGESFAPITDPAAAMEVLKKCVEKCAWSTGIIIDRAPLTDIWLVGQKNNPGNTAVSKTLETAICLFAKKIFSK